MLYPPPYIRSLPHSQFYCNFVFSVKSDCICVMGARPSLLCVCTYMAANAYCHLIGRDEENILSSCIDQSNDTIHLLRFMHTNQQRWPCIRLHPSHKYNHTSFMHLILSFATTFPRGARIAGLKYRDFTFEVYQ